MKKYSRTEEYLNIIKDELILKSKKIPLFTKHSLSIGIGNENLLKQFLKDHLPDTYGVATGFIYLDDENVSKQCDLLIYDKRYFSPIFKEGDFIIIHPKAVRACIEVKTAMNDRQFKLAIDNIVAAKNIMVKHDPSRKLGLYGIIFAFDSKIGVDKVEKMIRGLNRDNLDHMPNMVISLGKFILDYIYKDKVYRLATMQKSDDFSFPYFFAWLNELLIKISGAPIPPDYNFAEELKWYLPRLFDQTRAVWRAYPIKPGEPESEGLKYFKEAGKLLESKDYRKAYSKYQEAINFGFSEFIAIRNCGELAFLLGDYLKAEEFYKKALHARPADLQTIIGKAESLNKLNKFDEALKIINGFHPNNLEEQEIINSAKIISLIEKGDYNNAIKICDDFLSINPKSIATHINKALALKKLNKTNEITIPEDLIGKFKDYYLLAEYFAINREKDKMIKNLRMATRKWPKLMYRINKEIEFEDFYSDKDFLKLLPEN